jgi:hypothetical protein
MHELLRIRDVQIEDVWNLLAIYNDIIVNTSQITNSCPVSSGRPFDTLHSWLQMLYGPTMK